MEILFSFIETAPGLLKFLLNSSRIKKAFIQYLKDDFKKRILLIINEILAVRNINNPLALSESILFNTFDGLIERTLSVNTYTLSAMDISVALTISLNIHLGKVLNNDKIIDISFSIIDELKIESTYNEKFKLLILYLEKDRTVLFSNLRNREEIKLILNDNKSLFNTYFGTFQSDYSDIITVYYPGDNKTWIDYEEENSLQVSINMGDIPKGFFLSGLEYSHNNTWLTEAISTQVINRTEYREYFNPKEWRKGNTIWRR